MECIPLYENWEWSFDMIPIGEGGAETPDENNPDMKFTYEDLKTKSVAVHSSILPDQLFEFINMNDEDEVKTQSNSSRRITVGEVRGLKKEGETYKIPIEINGPAEAPNPSPHANTVSFVLTTVGDVYFLESGQRVRTIEVKNQNVLIGGRNATPDPQKQRPIIRLDREDVMNPQFEINKNNEDGNYYIRSIGNVSLCGNPLKEKKWKKLPNKASIVINGNIEVNFNRK